MNDENGNLDIEFPEGATPEEREIILKLAAKLAAAHPTGPTLKVSFSGPFLDSLRETIAEDPEGFAKALDDDAPTEARLLTDDDFQNN